jgi:hypothetical protein
MNSLYMWIIYIKYLIWIAFIIGLFKFTPFLRVSDYMQIKFKCVCPTPCKQYAQVWGLWSIKAQLKNLLAKVIEQ